ncbi:TRAFs-binding domain-containing protein [Streptomyces sp. NPDC058678]|uniref:TRAFs-binding domain-containing protein n=1 Tax=Streptomyces sp. NPDC058678 TaxID=3346595 RepID=UPI00365C2403
MIIVFTGRRPSGPDGVFPDAAVDWLEERLKLLIAGLRPRLAVGSAAAGTDLLAAGAALRAGIPVELLVTEDPEEFVGASVADKGPQWEERFRTLTTQAKAALIPVPGAKADDDGFRAVNQAILSHARDSLRHPVEAADEPEELVVVAVTEGRREGEDHTESLARSAEALGHLVLRLTPTQSQSEAPTAFVAMPYGVKADSTRELKRFEADESWHRVVVPALLDSGYRPIRTDLEAGLKSIDARMLHSINTADLFVADLATLNPNVLWELGVRHAWRPHATLLMAPNWVTPPFDLGHSTIQRYERGMKKVSDRQAVTAIRKLKAALNATRRGDDSPVWAVFPALEPVQLPPDADVELFSRLTRYSEEITLAAALRDAGKLLDLADQVRADGLPDSNCRDQLEQIGLALVTLGDFDEGRRLLEPLAAADVSFGRIRMQQRYALTLIHRAGTPVERLEYLKEAERRLLLLDDRHPGSSETWGLLGSAAKRAFELAFRLEEKNASAHLNRAIEAYRKGMEADPGDYYPGINALALVRVRGQHFDGGQDDVTLAESLLPVVRFAVERRPVGPNDTWEHATLAELALHQHLLDKGMAPVPPVEALRHYTFAAHSADGAELTSMRRQLEFLLAVGDPPEVLGPLLAALPAPAEGNAL